ncbi:MAG: response regulator [Lachnospira sp.]|nr:response regulator [Lachnospira sp.]
MKPISILIVEDDPIACSSFISNATDMPDIDIISITNNSTDAIQCARQYMPDAIILELELHKGFGTGLDVLKELKYASDTRHPFILVTTNNSSNIIYTYARKLGADFILSKHQSGYSEKSALTLITDIASLLEKDASMLPNNPAELTYKSQSIIKQNIINELYLVGICPKAIGFQYLVDAIQLTIKSSRHNIYKTIAKRYEKTENSVSRAMQNAIDKAWKTTDPKELAQYYTAKTDPLRGVPSITEFIYHYAHKLRVTPPF